MGGQDHTNHNKAPTLLPPHQKPLLLRSVARFLERSAFSKTLKKFRSEAKIQEDDVGGSSFDLEEIFCKFLDIRDHASEKVGSHNMQDLPNGGAHEGDYDSACAMETVSNSKKKKHDKSDIHVIDEQSGGGDKFKVSRNVEEVSNKTGLADVKPKEKKRIKNNSASLDQGEVSIQVLKEHTNEIVGASPDKKCKSKKKKKSNLDSDTHVDISGNHQSEPLLEGNADKCNGILSEGKKVTDSDTENKPKDNKKKKNNMSSDPLVDDNEQCVVADKKQSDVLLGKRKAKTKGKKVGKASDVSEGKLNGIDAKKDDDKTSKEDVDDKQDKVSKKRKRLSSEEYGSQPADEKAVEESKRRKVEDSEGKKGNEQHSKLKSSSEANEKALKGESNQIYSNVSQKSGEQVDGQMNGERSATQKMMKKQQSGSVEPKTANRFQRVNVDEVVFSDERLQDNSYWAKDGAENGYGAKAQEVLGQVKGRDFRHEKTKKKRGTYRGGQIDVQSHSIKFNYSDDE